MVDGSSTDHSEISRTCLDFSRTCSEISRTCLEISRTCAQYVGPVRSFSDCTDAVSRPCAKSLEHFGFFSVIRRVSPIIRSFSDCRGGLEGHGRRKFSDERKSSNMFEVSGTCAQFLRLYGRSFSALCGISRTYADFSRS